MTKAAENTTAAAELRHKAEEKVDSPYFKSSVQNEIYTSRILHELQVHQVELEFQNNELQRVIAEKDDHVTHLRNIIMQTPAGYFRIDPDGYFLDVNDSWLRMHGYDSKYEVIGKHLSLVQVDSNSSTALAHLAELKQGKAVPYGEFQSLRKDGTVGHHIFSAHPVVSFGTIVGFEWFIIDISDRIKAEMNLRRKQELLERTEKISHIGSWEWDLASGCMTWSDELFRIFQLNPADGAPSFEEQSKIYHPDDYEELKRVVGIALNEGTSYVIELRAIRHDCETRYCLARGFAERSIGERTVRLYGSLQDISESKKAEAEKAKLEIRLNQSQKMEAIGQLAGGVAHDFNNKLMAILGNAQLAKMDIHDTDKILHYLDEIRRAAEHSRDITYRLLAFSRQQVVSPQALEANKVIAESLKSLSRLIGEHISISFQPDDKLWNIRMDPVQLDQIVMNLAINARDAMPDGGSLTIETRNTTYEIDRSSNIDTIPGDYVMVTFSDTGIGMDKKTLKHIFEPFFTTKEVGKGTGLGLATIYGIIRQNSGFLEVSSNVGQGTEFRVYIPRFIASITETAKTVDTLCTGSCSILLVEDEDLVRSVTSEFLRRIGYTVHEAATPRAALELARDLSIQIDLVLTDFLMPEMNGRVMMEQILELRPQLLCMYASGFSTEHLLLSEDANFIQKPYDFIKLSGYINRVLGGSENNNG